MRENILNNRQKNWQTWLFILFLDIAFCEGDSWDYYNHLVTTLRMKPTLVERKNTVNLQTTWVWIAQVHFQFSSVTQSCPTLCDPMNRSTPGLPVHHQLPEFKLMSIESVMPSSHLILCRLLLLLPPIPPSMRVFYNESTFCMRWPKYWSFSFNISPSNEHPGLIFFRMDWLDLLAV